MIARQERLEIFKRDVNCYDVYTRQGRIAAIRSDFTIDEHGILTATPGTWYVRDETGGNGDATIYDGLRFASVTEAFALYCTQVLA